MNAFIFSKDHSLKAIVPLVLVLHAALFFFLLYYSTNIPLPELKKRIHVSSVKLQPQKKAPASTSSTEVSVKPQPSEQTLPQIESKPKPAPKAEPKPTPKAEPKPKPKPVEKIKPKPIPKTPKKNPPAEVKKKPPPKPAAAAKPKETAPPVDEKKKNLLNQARETIGKINLKKDNTIANSTATALPQRIDSLSIDQLTFDAVPSMGAHEVSYRDELAARLKLLLKLPEQGTVKLKLTLNRQGKVKNVQILSSESVKNRSFIEKRLPELSLPPFGTQFSGLEQYTFTITMSNHD